MNCEGCHRRVVIVVSSTILERSTNKSFKRLDSYWIHSIFSFHNATAVKGIWVASATADGLVPLFTVPLSIVVTNSSSGAILSANQSLPVFFIQH